MRRRPPDLIALGGAPRDGRPIQADRENQLRSHVPPRRHLPVRGRRRVLSKTIDPQRHDARLPMVHRLPPTRLSARGRARRRIALPLRVRRERVREHHPGRAARAVIACFMGRGTTNRGRRGQTLANERGSRVTHSQRRNGRWRPPTGDISRRAPRPIASCCPASRCAPSTPPHRPAGAHR